MRPPGADAKASNPVQCSEQSTIAERTVNRTVLTERQQQVLDFIRATLAADGRPPTLREIGVHMGIRSTNGVNDHLRALERKGYLVKDDMLSRGVRLTTPGQVMERRCPHCGGRGVIREAAQIANDVQVPEIPDLEVK